MLLLSNAHLNKNEEKVKHERPRKLLAHIIIQQEESNCSPMSDHKEQKKAEIGNC